MLICLKLNESKIMNSKLSICIVSVIYIFINAVLLFVAPYDTHLEQGADASSWYNPALSLLKHGAFVTLNDPTVLQTYRPPLYPIFEAFMLFIGNGNIILIIIGQIALLLLTGVMVYSMVEKILPNKGTMGLSLVIFNPNALGTAHLVQSDILYMFMVTTTLYLLLLYSTRGCFKLSVLIGLSFGLTCLVRTSGQYLILMLPIIYVVIAFLKRSEQPLFTHFKHGLMALIVSVVVVFPWVQHNANAGWGYTLTTPEIEIVYFRDNIIYLESILSDVSLNDAENKVTENEQKFILSYGKKWLQMSKQDRASTIVSYYKKQLLTYDYKTISIGFIDSWIGMFGAGGAVNLHNILALGGDKSIQVMANSKQHVSRVSAVFSALLNSNLIVIAISLFSFIYVIALRIFGLIGLFRMTKDRQYGLLFVLTGSIIYFTLIALFVGNSRYRLPIEPALTIMAIYGFSFLVNKESK